jgi:hypothetical protein
MKFTLGCCGASLRHSVSKPAPAKWGKAPYRLEIVEDVQQPALQAAPERMTPLLLEHLSKHAH